VVGCPYTSNSTGVNRELGRPVRQVSSDVGLQFPNVRQRFVIERPVFVIVARVRTASMGAEPS